MTRAGIMFIAGGVAVYVLGSQSQIGWFYLFDAMIWSAVILSAVFPRWNLSSLRVERQVPVAHIGELVQRVSCSSRG